MTIPPSSLPTHQSTPPTTQRYSGRDFSPEDLALIRALIADNPTCNRADLSRLTCQALGWYKADGGLKQMSCRVAMLRMQDDGLIQLPVPTGERPKSRIVFTKRTAAQAVIEEPGNRLAPLQLCLVESRAHSRLWNEYIHRYHYLGYKTLPGAQLRYFVTSGEQFVALLGFGASAWQAAPRDNYIGWSHDQRKARLHRVVNNARFLILPWVRSKNLASMILSTAAKRLPTDWESRYHYRPVLLETFVEKDRFVGTSYKAANWTYVGETKGRGKLGPAAKQSVPIKAMWLYPLTRDFRATLTQ
jgi:Druantia protein DruA